MFRKDLRGPDLDSDALPPELTPEEQQQFAAARASARVRIDAGEFGSKNHDDFLVRIEGHANLNHVADPNLPREFLTLTISYSPLST